MSKHGAPYNPSLKKVFNPEKWKDGKLIYGIHSIVDHVPVIGLNILLVQQIHNAQIHVQV